MDNLFEKALNYALLFLTSRLIENLHFSHVPTILGILEWLLRDRIALASTRQLLTIAFFSDVSSLKIPAVYWAVVMKALGGRAFTLVLDTKLIQIIYYDPIPKTIVVWSDTTPAPTSPECRSTRHPAEINTPISPLALDDLVHSAVARKQTRIDIPKPFEADRRPLALGSLMGSALPRRRALTEVQKPFEAKLSEGPVSGVRRPLALRDLVGLALARRHTSNEVQKLFDPKLDEEGQEVLTQISNCTIDALSPISDTFTIKPTSQIKPICTSTTALPYETFKFSPFSSDDTSIPSSDELETDTSTVFVDKNKKNTARFMYEDGVCMVTVISGGVMLGPHCSSGPPSGEQVLLGQSAASANTWRTRVRFK